MSVALMNDVTEVYNSKSLLKLGLSPGGYI